MAMRSIIKPQKCYVPNNGDLLWWRDYFLPFNKKVFKRKQIIMLSMIGVNTWKVLIDLRILPEAWVKEQLDTKLTYVCPWFKHKYYAVMPIAILSDNVSKFYPEKLQPSMDMIFDQDWVQKMYMKKKSFYVNNLTEAQLGHGYTYGTLPDDGIGKKIDLLLNMGEGDFIVARTWEWYNK